MTVQEIKDAITIKSESQGDFGEILIATFQIQSSVGIHRDYTNDAAVRAVAQEQLEYNILRMLFDDSRKAMAEALERLDRVNPMNYAEYRQAVDAVYSAARFQKKEMHPMPETIA